MSNRPVNHEILESIQPDDHVSNQLPMLTRSKTNIFSPKAYFTKVDCLFDTTPANIHEAMANLNWRDVVNSEMQALLKNQT